MYDGCTPYIQDELSMNGTGFRVRVDDELKDEFIQICKANDLTAAQVIRQFMRSYVEESKSTSTANNVSSKK
jgi:hypothetical protein